VSGLCCCVVTYDDGDCKWFFFCTAFFGIYERVKTASGCYMMTVSGFYSGIFSYDGETEGNLQVDSAVVYIHVIMETASGFFSVLFSLESIKE
jgi:hypothetical protein